MRRFEELQEACGVVYGKADGEYFFYDSYGCGVNFTTIDTLQYEIDADESVDVTEFITRTLSKVDEISFLYELKPVFEKKTKITCYTDAFWGLDRDSLEEVLFDLVFDMQYICCRDELWKGIHELSIDGLVNEIMKADAERKEEAC